MYPPVSKANMEVAKFNGKKKSTYLLYIDLKKNDQNWSLIHPYNTYGDFEQSSQSHQIYLSKNVNVATFKYMCGVLT